MANIITIIDATYETGLSLRILFSDGTERIIDFSEFLSKHPHPQYDRFAKPSNFKKFTIRNGNVIWGKHADLIFPVGALYLGNPELCCDEV
jgi:hypothetical protein